ncbi:hypothetical protein Hanom_Chr05g00388071 [Helianthus anomalus]
MVLSQVTPSETLQVQHLRMIYKKINLYISLKKKKIYISNHTIINVEVGYCTNCLNVRCVRDAVSNMRFFFSNMRFWFFFKQAIFGFLQHATFPFWQGWFLEEPWQGHGPGKFFGRSANFPHFDRNSLYILCLARVCPGFF